jgi:hypothetical protein
LKQIDHDPEEPPRDNSWRGLPIAFFAMLAILWVGSLAVLTLDWHSVALGALTGGAFAGAVIEYTGNRVPKWMRR